MQTRNLVLACLLVIAIGASVAMSYYYSSKVIEVKRIPYDYNATTGLKVGVNLDPGTLHFGKIPVGFDSSRVFSFTNTRDESVLLRLSATGSGAGAIGFDRNPVEISAYGEARISVIAIPQQEGFFQGDIVVTITRP